MMLIRFEQIVWQKRHNVLNPVWHLKGLNIIILLLSQSVFLQSVGFASVCLVCQSGMKTAWQISEFRKSSWWVKAVFTGPECVTFLFKGYPTFSQSLLSDCGELMLFRFMWKFCINYPAQSLIQINCVVIWMNECELFPDACQSSNTEEKDDRKKEKNLALFLFSGGYF